jgi:hypothetical protein
MTKEAYFEMCEALGNEPIPEEIPLDASDMSYETMSAVQCYKLLPDNYTGMGDYLGKNLSNLSNIYDLLNIPNHEKEYILESILYMDNLVIKDIARKRKAEMAATKKGR